ncbi:MAG TPA: 50S ribosomal protein L11 methyltransferase, partial [Blastocatellia bacterium]|nr:50S ribosomal protein L11 methyltransferase [Blastocatellia bacterium]
MWRVVEISVEPAQAELLGSLLFDLGTTGLVTLDEATERTLLAAYFGGRSRRDDLCHAIEETVSRSSLTATVVGITELPDQDWMLKWKDGFEQVSIGERLVIAPSWKVVEPNS